MSRALTLAAAALALAALTGCGVSTGASGSEAPKSRGLVAAWQRGVNFVAFSADGYSQALSDDQLRALHATGTRSVEIVVTWYMDDAAGTGVGPDATTPTDASILHAMQTAKGLGMQVILKPHIDLHDKSFRGMIAPTDVQGWFASYLGMTQRYADLARTGGASTYVVGTELTNLATQYPDQWKAIIAEARKRFSGTLTYAANWVDEAEKIMFWDQLDEVAIDAYMPLDTGAANPTVDQLVSAWQPYVSRISALHDRIGKPVVFTELGYESRQGAAQRPAGGGRGAPNQGSQARAYDAAFRVWSKDKPWFEGISWWAWWAEGPQAGADADFTPQGKLAQQTLERWYAYPTVAS